MATDEPTQHPISKTIAGSFAADDDEESPFHRTAASEHQLACLRLVRALRGGSQAMRDERETLLPKFEKESTAAYDRRLKGSFLLPAYDDAIGLHRGEAFPEPIQFHEDLPEAFTPWLRDVDLEGRSLDQWAPKAFEAGEDDGVVFILVDKTRLAEGSTLADQEAMGARPYLVLIRASDVLGWRHRRDDTGVKLLQFRYRFESQVPSGLYGSAMEERVRVISVSGQEGQNGVAQVFKRDEKGNPILVSASIFGMDKIPVVPFYTNEDGYFRGRPFLGKLADKNLEHWQSASDQRNALRTARIPFFAFLGFKQEDADRISALGSGLKVSNVKETAKVEVVEHTGAAIESGRNDLLDLERQMEALSKAPLLIHPPGNITATKTAVDTARGACAIREMLIDFEASLDKVLHLMGEWNSVDNVPDDPVILFKDVGIEDEQQWQAEMIRELWIEGKIGTDVAIPLLNRLDVWPEDITAEQVKQSVKDDKKLNGTDEAERSRIAAELMGEGRFQTIPEDGEEEDDESDEPIVEN